jgi:hypothetical protein
MTRIEIAGVKIMKLILKSIALLVTFPLIALADNYQSAASAVVAKKMKASASLGTNSGGGGDHDGQAFTAIGRLVKDQLVEQKGSVKIDTEEFEKALQVVEVEFVNEPLFLNDVKKDAINYPKTNKIRVYKSAWDEMSLNAKRALVLHEYLGIMEIEDSTYGLSYKLLNLKPEKFQCTVMMSNNNSRDRAQLSTRVDSTYDGGLKYDSEAVKLSRERLVLGDEIVVVIWNLEKENKTNPWDGARFTTIYIESSKLPGTLQFSMNFESKDGKYKSSERESVNVSFLYTKENVLGQSKRLGESNATASFPGSSRLGLSIAELGFSAVADCRVR